jgi:hypothetical protein
MSRVGGWLMVAALTTLAIAGAGPAWAAGSIVLPRAGQVGIGIQGGYGGLLKTGDLGNDFSNGPTIAVRLRYRMRYERALGLSFENERFEIRVPEAIDPTTGFPGRTRVNAVLSGLEFYQMFGTRTRTTKMLMVGAGIAQTSGRTLDNDTFYPGNGTFVSVGGGFERFLIRSWAIDLSARYMAVFLPDDRNHEGQVALGFIWYASY